jgi:hypothetical protein
MTPLSKLLPAVLLLAVLLAVLLLDFSHLAKSTKFGKVLPPIESETKPHNGLI